MAIDSKVIEKITKLGLGEKATGIYLFLLEQNKTFPSRISKETKITRGSVYRILDELVAQGLVVEVEKKNKLFYQYR
ncbi:helix-turn-helix domain-containing protein [Patescibacteria group bacterium]|nr:helix-turn-helix domain-containing protein [Patescibacteria group bacterium]MBU1721830.1 helix-turn-helix domain-containing protein [Patescibacteria group bacterium]MBU1901675.1 helix-turn-helix domain-containing protein [Patescibacteria group bacterium]